MISTEWTEDLTDPKQKQDREEIIRHSTVMARRLLELCNKWERDVLAGMVKNSNFDRPAWSEQQGAFIGDLSRIRKLKDLLSFMEHKYD